MRFHRLLYPLLVIFVLAMGGCASGPAGGSPAQQAINATGARFLHFILSVNPNGVVDQQGRGYYVILLNSQGDPIEVTDLDTFTDFIRFDGTNFDWYHRQANQPNPGFTFVQAGSLNASGTLATDRKSFRVILDIGESTSFINQFIVSNRFTAHAVTSDNFQNAIIGRLLDTMGPGPSIGSNTQQTIMVQKGAGAVQPFPSFYPDDPLNDWITRDDLPPDYPYANFDIAKLEIIAQ